ncbi:hypothetical protein BJY21_001276 [Kineosphaera limosa]|uniref:ABC-2 transporter permease n=1 Tax=Kineosphaera limosa TaxID=111564 RepID=UPI0012FB59CA|nr:hypothetical protein [Kineosphaera limosa]
MSAQVGVAPGAQSARSSVRQALLLDWRAVESGSVTVVLVAFPLVGGFGMWLGGTSLPSTLVVLWAAMVALTPWRSDDTAVRRLRPSLGLPRRSIVTARYLWAGTAVLGLVLVTTIYVPVVGLLLNRPAAEELTLTWWLGTGVMVVLAAGIPARIRRGRAASTVVMILVAVGTLALSAATMVLVPIDSDMTAYNLVAFALTAALAVIAVPLSYLDAQRAYATKDL